MSGSIHNMVDEANRIGAAASGRYTPPSPVDRGLFTGFEPQIPRASAQDVGLTPMAMYSAYKMGATPSQLGTMNQYAQPLSQPGAPSNLPTIAQTPMQQGAK